MEPREEVTGLLRQLKCEYLSDWEVGELCRLSGAETSQIVRAVLWGEQKISEGEMLCEDSLRCLLDYLRGGEAAVLFRKNRFGFVLVEDCFIEESLRYRISEAIREFHGIPDFFREDPQKMLVAVQLLCSFDEELSNQSFQEWRACQGVPSIYEPKRKMLFWYYLQGIRILTELCLASSTRIGETEVTGEQVVRVLDCWLEASRNFYRHELDSFAEYMENSTPYGDAYGPAELDWSAFPVGDAHAEKHFPGCELMECLHTVSKKYHAYVGTMNKSAFRKQYFVRLLWEELQKFDQLEVNLNGG